MSLLFDKFGITKGVRIISDDRVSHNERKTAYGLFIKLESTFGKDPWECLDFGPAEGEAPIAGMFAKKLCIKEKSDKTILLRGDYYRKKGQTSYDRLTKKPTVGYFASSTRLEVYSKDITLDLKEFGWIN